MAQHQASCVLCAAYSAPCALTAFLCCRIAAALHTAFPVTPCNTKRAELRASIQIAFVLIALTLTLAFIIRHPQLLCHRTTVSLVSALYKNNDTHSDLSQSFLYPHLRTLHTPISRRQPTEHTPTIIILWQLNHQFQTLFFHSAFGANQFRCIPTILSERGRKENL
jgi:hypothetical protein